MECARSERVASSGELNGRGAGSSCFDRVSFLLHSLSWSRGCKSREGRNAQEISHLDEQHGKICGGGGKKEASATWKMPSYISTAAGRYRSFSGGIVLCLKGFRKLRAENLLIETQYRPCDRCNNFSSLGEANLVQER